MKNRRTIPIIVLCVLAMTETYVGPMNLTDVETLNKEFDEGIMIGKDWYQNDDNMGGYVKMENVGKFWNEEQLHSEFLRCAIYASSLGD